MVAHPTPTITATGEAFNSSSRVSKPNPSSQSCNAYAYQISIIYTTNDSTNHRQSRETKVKPCTWLHSSLLSIYKVVNIFMNYRLVLPPPASSAAELGQRSNLSKIGSRELKTQSWINKAWKQITKLIKLCKAISFFSRKAATTASRKEFSTQLS